MGAGDSFVQAIDVSKYQTTTPDLTGVKLLIARAGIGTKPDPTYDMHIANAKKAGIRTGSYWFNYGPLSVSEQVDAYRAREGNVDIHVIDWEGVTGFTAAQTKQFISLYKSRTGNKIWLYASESKFEDLGQDHNWIANYSQEPHKAYDMWQYGPFRGADGDWLRADLATLIGVPLVKFISVIEGKVLNVAQDYPWKFLDGTPGGTFSKPATVQILGKIDGHNDNYVARISTGIPYADGVSRPTDVLIVTTSALSDAPVVPPVVQTVTIDASQAQIDAAKAAQKTIDDAARVAAVASTITAERSRVLAVIKSTFGL